MYGFLIGKAVSINMRWSNDASDRRVEGRFAEEGNKNKMRLYESIDNVLTGGGAVMCVGFDVNKMKITNRKIDAISNRNRIRHCIWENIEI